jgi:hypothetical protein
MSCGGHILSGDTPDSTLKRELEEELGIVSIKPKLVDKYVLTHTTQSELIYLYYAITEFEPSQLDLQKEEVEKVEWIDPSEAQRMVLEEERESTQFVFTQITKILNFIAFPDNILELVRNFVEDSFGKKSDHFERTLYWIKQLKPDADLALQISAYSHDIQRAFANEESLKKVENSDNGFKDETMLKEHQEGGGDIMYKFLIEHGQTEELAEKVKHLISKHEIGGDEEQNLLKDADSVSYFECNADHFVTKYAPVLGKEKVKSKFDWMFERITSDQAKELAEPMYKEALDKLLK